MSIDSVLARMNALQALVDSASGAAAPATGNTAAFSAAMNAATASTGTDTNAPASLANLASPPGTPAAFAAAMTAAPAPTGTDTSTGASFANLASPIGTATIPGATDATATGG